MFPAAHRSSSGAPTVFAACIVVCKPEAANTVGDPDDE